MDFTVLALLTLFFGGCSVALVIGALDTMTQQTGMTRDGVIFTAGLIALNLFLTVRCTRGLIGLWKRRNDTANEGDE